MVEAMIISLLSTYLLLLDSTILLIYDTQTNSSNRYSCLSNFDKAAKWNTLTGSATLLLCLAVIEEIIIVLIYEICGLALTKRVNKVSIDSADGYQGEAPQQKQERTTLQKIGHFLAHYTIFGLLIGPLFRKSRKSSPKESQMPLNQQELSSA